MMESGRGESGGERKCGLYVDIGIKYIKQQRIGITKKKKKRLMGLTFI